MLIDDVIRGFIFELQVQNYSIRTVKGYKNNINKFIEYCKNEYNTLELEEVNHIHIKKYFQYLLLKGRSPVYVNNILKNIRSFFKYCYKEEYINRNIALKVSWQREEKTVIKTFNDKEVGAMVGAYHGKGYLEARNKCIISILFDTGIRNLELCTLGILDVKDTVIYIKGKGRKERVVPISPILKRIMIKYERIRAEYIKDSIIRDDAYFLSYRGKRMTGEAIERVVKLCGESVKVRRDIRCSPHTCRHYFAQAQLKNGLDVYSLSRLLGHEDISITKRYLQGIQDDNIVEMSIKTSPLMNLK